MLATILIYRECPDTFMISKHIMHSVNQRKELGHGLFLKAVVWIQREQMVPVLDPFFREIKGVFTSRVPSVILS